MKANKKLVPELRFPEFEGEWEERRLGEFTSWSSGGTPSKKKSNYWNGNIPWISASSMRGTEYYTSNAKITEEGLKNGTKLAPKGVLLLLVRGSMLFKKIPIGITKRDVAFNQDVKSIKIGSLSSSKYILCWFLASEAIILNMVTGTGIGAGKLDLADLKALKINLPSLAEQQKIANFLTSIDQRIQILSQKKKLLEQYKKGLMQKIFKQEIRFKDANGKDFPDWEEKKLGEVCEMTSSKRVYVSDYVEKGIPFYRGKEISELRLGKTPSDILYITEKRYLDYKSKYGVPSKNDILITAVGTLGNVLKIKDDKPFYFKDGNLIWLKNIKLYSSFLEIALQWNTNAILKTSIGSTQKALTMVELRKLKLSIPIKKEQTLIANFLTTLDQKITLVNTQLNQTKKYKKALLQKMFV